MEALRAFSTGTGREFGIREPAIDCDRFAHHVVARPRGEVDRGARHVFIAPYAPQRCASGDDIRMIAGRAVHIRCEWTWCNGGDQNALGEFDKKMIAEVQTALQKL